MTAHSHPYLQSTLCPAACSRLLAALVCVLNMSLFRDMFPSMPNFRRTSVIAGVSASVHRGHGRQGEEGGA